jgi:hypothetical protein
MSDYREVGRIHTRPDSTTAVRVAVDEDGDVVLDFEPGPTFFLDAFAAHRISEMLGEAASDADDPSSEHRSDTAQNSADSAPISRKAE